MASFVVPRMLLLCLRKASLYELTENDRREQRAIVHLLLLDDLYGQYTSATINTRRAYQQAISRFDRRSAAVGRAKLAIAGRSGFERRSRSSATP